MTDNYDRLSVIGELQAKLLGKDWILRSLRFDRVYTGPRVRQRNTVKFVSAIHKNAGLSFPTPEVMPEFDEYAAETVMQYGLSILLESDERARDLNASFLAAIENGEKHLTFQRLFEYVLANGLVASFVWTVKRAGWNFVCALTPVWIV